MEPEVDVLARVDGPLTGGWLLLRAGWLRHRNRVAAETGACDGGDDRCAGEKLKSRAHACHPAERPHVVQYFQPTSSSVPHAGQLTTVRF